MKDLRYSWRFIHMLTRSRLLVKFHQIYQNHRSGFRTAPLSWSNLAISLLGGQRNPNLDSILWNCWRVNRYHYSNFYHWIYHNLIVRRVFNHASDWLKFDQSELSIWKTIKAKQFGSEHGYKVDPTQEAVASSMSNLFGSFFFIMPTSCSLSRTSLQVLKLGIYR